MTIYNRDFTILTENEISEWNRIEENSKIAGSMFRKKNDYSKLPKAIRHYKSLFPNNYLDNIELKEEERLHNTLNQFLTLLNNQNPTERTLLNFIRDQKAYFIIASLFTKFNFGHHGAYIFPEFQLGNDYQVDYLLIGKGSGGYEFIFVELEDPYKNITLKDGNLGNAYRKGLIQVDDWNTWLAEDFSSISRTFDKYKKKDEYYPKEFLKFDPSRCHFVVIAGRREDFEKEPEKTYKIRREYEIKKTYLYHYDNLYDFSKSIIGRVTY